jgi:hypothetical protein
MRKKADGWVLKCCDGNAQLSMHAAEYYYPHLYSQPNKPQGVLIGADESDCGEVTRPLPLSGD